MAEPDHNQAVQELGVTPKEQRTRMLAIASAGGHWVQLQRLFPAWQDLDVVYVSTNEDVLIQASATADESRSYAVVDANAKSPMRVALLFSQIVRILWRERPPIVLSTGAAPGCLALLVGKLLGAKTIWIDSIANSERLSLSAKLVRPLADVWLTQWEDLSSRSFLGRKPEFAGNVL